MLLRAARAFLKIHFFFFKHREKAGSRERDGCLMALHGGGGSAFPVRCLDEGRKGWDCCERKMFSGKITTVSPKKKRREDNVYMHEEND